MDFNEIQYKCSLQTVVKQAGVSWKLVQWNQ